MMSRFQLIFFLLSFLFLFFLEGKRLRILEVAGGVTRLITRRRPNIDVKEDQQWLMMILNALLRLFKFKLFFSLLL